jgi:hypothetical protein
MVSWSSFILVMYSSKLIISSILLVEKNLIKVSKRRKEMEWNSVKK